MSRGGLLVVWLSIQVSLAEVTSWAGFLASNVNAVQHSKTPPQTPLHGFGTSRYDDSAVLPTWGDLSRRDMHLGAVCDADAAGASSSDQAETVSECGFGLVCRAGICRHCTEDDECAALHVCKQLATTPGHTQNFCMPIGKKAWEVVFSDPYEFLCTVLIFLAAMLAAAAGAGGGGVFVPLLVLLSSSKAESAVPLSQTMVLAGSIVNLSVLVAQKHPLFPGKPRIDYECVALFVPMLALGVTLGVLVHQTIPKWFLIVLLMTTLGLALWRTASKGFKQLEQERHIKVEQSPQMSGQPEEAGLRSHFYNAAELISRHKKAVLAICCVQILMLVASLQRQSVCSWNYVWYIISLSFALVLATAAIDRYVVRSLSEEDTSPTVVLLSPGGKQANTPRALELAKYPAVAFAAGFLGGLLGLGGGIILGPVLLEIGLHGEAVQATTAAFVFLSSSIACIQFAVLGAHIWHYAVWYAVVVASATLIGQWGCEYVIRTYKRPSLITFAIAGLLLCSLLALSVVSVGQLSDDVRLGRQMWFSTTRLCSSGSMSIVAVDATPETVFPSDMAFF